MNDESEIDWQKDCWRGANGSRIWALSKGVHNFSIFVRAVMGPVVDQLMGEVDGGSLTESIFISVIGKNFEKNSKEHCSSLIFFQTWFYHFEQIRMKNI